MRSVAESLVDADAVTEKLIADFDAALDIVRGEIDYVPLTELANMTPAEFTSHANLSAAVSRLEGGVIGARLRR